MTEFFVVNERTLPRLLWAGWRGRRPVVLAVTPLVLRLRGLLVLAVERACRSGHVRWVYDLYPELWPVRESEAYGQRLNMFAITEPWLARYFGFAGADRALADYGLAYKYLCCKTSATTYNTVLVLRHVLERVRPENVAVVGLDDHDEALFEAYTGRAAGIRVVASGQGRRVVNLALAAAFLGGGVAWILRHVRLRPPPPETVRLGSDFIADPRDVALWREITNNDFQVLIVLRNRDQLAQADAIAPGFRRILPDAGVFGPWQALRAIGLVLADIVRLYRRCWTMPTRFFYPIIALPVRRARYRALFDRFRFDLFWGRDDYNVEHIIRSQELRRIGGTALGINHGLPIVCPVAAEWRYLDFDRYYVFGRALYDRYMRETWPGHMRVVPIGSYAMTRERWSRLGEPKPPDVVFFVNPDPMRERAVREIFRLAELLPERIVFIKLKPGKERLMAGVTALCRQAPTNVRLADDRDGSYDFLFRCRYVLAITTTLLAEAVQFGCVAFALDIYGKNIPHYYYREFPDLVVESAEEAAKRIRRIEDGTWTYPRERFGDLIDLSGRCGYEIIREDLGLAARERPVAAALSA